MGTTLFEAKKGGSQALREKAALISMHYTFALMEGNAAYHGMRFSHMALHGLTWPYTKTPLL
ncbi:MAG: hypothetical protein MJ136_04060 [Clostridia bacterium]|nr:hypothetical protein [Clostridia bacterium]